MWERDWAVEKAEEVRMILAALNHNAEKIDDKILVEQQATI